MNETRSVKAEYRAEGTTAPQLRGTAVVYNSLSQPLFDRNIGAFREVIKPGAFNKTLNSNAEVKADLNHDQNSVIGRRSKGTLILNDTPTGLNTVITPSDTSWGRDAIEAVRAGDYDGMSFEFKTNPQGERVYRDADGGLIREINDATLFRVSVVAEPAYEQTQVECRSLKDFVEQEKNNKNQRDRSYYERLLKTI